MDKKLNVTAACGGFLLNTPNSADLLTHLFVRTQKLMNQKKTKIPEKYRKINSTHQQVKFLIKATKVHLPITSITEQVRKATTPTNVPKLQVPELPLNTHTS
uniref:Uncharacterized protein n=1 Tax=Romanomermis culicivorax TaxID=13658 RepID=A0A915IKF3_ROMCU